MRSVLLRCDQAGTLAGMVVALPGIGEGVLHPQAYAGQFNVARFRPEPPLDRYIEIFWTVTWDRGELDPFEQFTLPTPAVNVVLERSYATAECYEHVEVVGLIRGRFRRLLEGHGRVFGAKFQPAMFRPFIQSPVSSLTDERLPLQSVLGADPAPLLADVLSAADEPAMARRYAAFWRDRLPAADARADNARQLVEHIAATRALTQVHQLAEHAAMPVRALQRLFRDYVGVSPKWVIQRFRLVEAAEALVDGPVDQCQLALRLGFADQAHFVRAFRRLVGTTPAAYARANRQPDEREPGNEEPGNEEPGNDVKDSRRRILATGSP